MENETGTICKHGAINGKTTAAKNFNLNLANRRCLWLKQIADSMETSNLSGGCRPGRHRQLGQPPGIHGLPDPGDRCVARRLSRRLDSDHGRHLHLELVRTAAGELLAQLNVLLAAGQISGASLGVMQAALDRVEAGKSLNAFITVTAEAAMRGARERLK